MNITELREGINFFCENSDSIILETYFALKKDDENILKRVDLEESAQKKLKDDFIQVIADKIVGNKDLEIQDISEGTNENNIILRYDIEMKPEALTLISDLTKSEEWDTFSFGNDNLAEVTGIIFLIHKDDYTLVSYKKTYPINLYKKDSRGVKVWKPRDSDRFIEITEDIYSIYPDMDFFQLNNELFIFNLKVLERFFGFHDVIVSTANEAIEKIDEIGILVDSDVLKNIISEMSQARKLTQIGMHSPVVGNITNEVIIEFINKHPALTGKFKFNEDNTKIELDTKVSAKLFIKLLNDDFLLSELTRLHYDTRAKSKIADTTNT